MVLMDDRVVCTPKEGTTTDTKGFTIYDMTENQPTAKEFLDSIARNSKASQRNYAAGLLNFHKFLGIDGKGKCTLTTIVESLAKNE
jgi:spermidine/putrescine-binding protein